MHATLEHLTTIASGTLHHAFTDLVQWRGAYYCAYRTAMTHDIVPPGHITVRRGTPWRGQIRWPTTSTTLSHPTGDLRDPKFIPTPRTLWLMAGLYLPHPAQPMGALSRHPEHNIIQTHLTYTTDGATWAPWTPILRPGHWGWSSCATAAQRYIAAYYTGAPHEPTSLTLWEATQPLTTTLLGTIYDGVSFESEGPHARFPHLVPTEPVLYRPTPETFGCLVRTEDGLDIGVCKTPCLQDWRWWQTREPLHPSAILQTPHGWLLAARHLRTITERSHTSALRPRPRPTARIETSTTLWHLRGQFLEPVLTLPSGGDCGYAGVAFGPQEETILCSYYSAHAYATQGECGTTVPAADVHVATVRLAA